MERQQIKELKTKIVAALALLTPYLKQIAQEKIIPWVKKNYYKRVENAVSKMLQKLTELGTKILICTEPDKKSKHIIGFQLGFTFVKTLKIVIDETAMVLADIEKQIEMQDIIGEDEIPF